MRKVLTIARREYFAMVATKAFLFTIAMMPILMFGGIIATGALSKVGDVEDKTIVIVDETGELFAKLNESARSRNESIDRSRSSSRSVDDEEHMANLASEPKYILQEKAGEQLNDESRWDLSEQIRSGEFNAFVEIPREILQVPEDRADGPTVSFYAPDATISDARRWLDRTLNEQVKTKRFQDAGIDPLIVARASQPVTVIGLGLFKRVTGGEIKKPEEKEKRKTWSRSSCRSAL